MCISFLPLCRLGHKECVLELLNLGKIESANFSLDLNQEDKSGFSPLVLAVYGGHTDVVVALIKRYVLTTSNFLILLSVGWMSTNVVLLVPLPSMWL